MPTTLTVNLRALKGNYDVLYSCFKGRELGAVVKADGYGLGAVPVAKRLAEAGCRTFFVAHMDEALALRDALSEPRIFVFHGAPKGEEKLFVEKGLTPVVNSLEALAHWQPFAEQHPAALHVDTGMTRLGLTHTELAQVKQPISLLMSHLACANTPYHPQNAEQLARFNDAAQLFPAVPKSLCNSAGVFLDSTFHFNLARTGCALYGINPTEADKNPMQHVATWSAPILQVRHLDRDEAIGYGATCVFPKGSRIAILEVGYADGYMRLLSNRGTVFFGDDAAPVVGRVSMDMIAVDVSHLGDAQLRDADILCKHQTVDEIAQQCGTIGYEILTNIGSRVQRRYS
jgi:alanine racemase